MECVRHEAVEDDRVSLQEEILEASQVAQSGGKRPGTVMVAPISVQIQLCKLNFLCHQSTFLWCALCSHPDNAMSIGKHLIDHLVEHGLRLVDAIVASGVVAATHWRVR